MSSLQCFICVVISVFLLQETHAQHSSSRLPEEIQILEVGVQTTMAKSCELLGIVHVACEWGIIPQTGVKHVISRVINSALKIGNKRIKIMYAIVYLAYRITVCLHEAANSVWPIIKSGITCIKHAAHTLLDYIKNILTLIGKVCRQIYDFAKKLQSCRGQSIDCIDKAFVYSAFNTVNTMTVTVATTTRTALKLTHTRETRKCHNSLGWLLAPAATVNRCAKCIFCTFKSGANICN